MSRDVEYCMKALRLLAADTTPPLWERLLKGAAPEIDRWAAQAGADRAERRRMLQALAKEVILEEATHYWNAVRDIIGQRLNAATLAPR